jgi:hypothetical protein
MGRVLAGAIVAEGATKVGAKILGGSKIAYTLSFRNGYRNV